MDSVNAFAFALDNITRSQCLGLHDAALRQCIHSTDLLYQLRQVQFSGYSGNISFNSNGDVMSGYELINYISDGDYRSVGFFDVEAGTWNIQEEDIVWPALERHQRKRYICFNYLKILQVQRLLQSSD